MFSTWRSWIFPFLAGVLTLIFLMQSYSASRLKSPTADEPNHITAGLSYVQTGVFALNPEHPPLLKELAGLSMVLGGICWPKTAAAADELKGTGEPIWSFGNKVLLANGPDRILSWARLPLIVVSTLGGLVLYLFGCEIVGKRAALGALFLYALDPTIVAHSFLVTTDVGLAAFMVLFLWTLYRYLQRPSMARLLLAGATMGLMLCAKFSAVFVLPVAGLLMLAGLCWPTPEASHANASLVNPYRAEGTPWIKRALACTGCFAIVCGVALLVIEAVYLSPRGVALYDHGVHMVNSNHDPSYLAYMAGHLDNRFRTYLAVCYLLKEPIASIILVVLGLFELRRTKEVSLLQQLFLLLPLVFLLTSHVMLADNAGIRYLIPALPFVYLIGGLGLAMLFRYRTVLARGLAVGLLAWMIVEAVGIYPDHLSYFNEAACVIPGRLRDVGLDGGSACGTLWLDDSNIDWGQGSKQLRDWVDKNLHGRTFQLAAFQGFPPSDYGVSYQQVSFPNIMRGPTPGLYILSAHDVAFLPAIGAAIHPGDALWLRETRPVAIIGHAFYVYDIQPKSANTAAAEPVPAQASPR